MSRVISETQFQQALKDKKIDPRATREARRHDSSSPEVQPDHPLIAQGKAMQEVARRLGDQGRAMEGAVRELGDALKNQGGESTATVKALAVLIEQNNAIVRQMMANMAAMHREHMNMDGKKKEGQKTVFIKVNRTPDRYVESMELTVTKE